MTTQPDDTPRPDVAALLERAADLSEERAFGESDHDDPFCRCEWCRDYRIDAAALRALAGKVRAYTEAWRAQQRVMDQKPASAGERYRLWSAAEDAEFFRAEANAIDTEQVVLAALRGEEGGA